MRQFKINKNFTNRTEESLDKYLVEITYAIWWIRQSILQAIAEYSNMVRRPQSQLAISNKIKNATNEFLQKHQRYPSAEELSEIIELEIGKIEKAIQDDAHMSSIDAPISDDDTATPLLPSMLPTARSTTSRCAPM